MLTAPKKNEVQKIYPDSLGYKYTQKASHSSMHLNFLSSISKPSNRNSMENPANRTQHNRGLNNGRRNGSTLPETENTVRDVAKQTRGNPLARWGNDRANDLKVHPVLYKCSICQKRFDNLRVICSHLRKHNCRPYRGLTTPSNVVCFYKNERPEDEDREIWVDGRNCLQMWWFFFFFQISMLCMVRVLHSSHVIYSFIMRIIF